MIWKLLGFNKKIKIYEKTSGGTKIVNDYGKIIRTKGGIRKLDIWKGHVKLPLPPNGAIIDKVIHVYRTGLNIEDYRYLTLDEKTNKLKPIDMDMNNWAEQEIRETFTKYEERGFLEKYMPYIAMGVFMVIIVIGLVIYFQNVIAPMMDKGLTAKCVCEGAKAVANAAGAKPPI